MVSFLRHNGSRLIREGLIEESVVRKQDTARARETWTQSFGLYGNADPKRLRNLDSYRHPRTVLPTCQGTLDLLNQFLSSLGVNETDVGGVYEIRPKIVADPREC